MRRNNYRSFGCYNKSNYGKPKYITKQGYFILHNGGYGGYFWISIPTYITKLLSRLRQTRLKLKVLFSKFKYISFITIFRGESKLNRVAYINQLTNNLL